MPKGAEINILLYKDLYAKEESTLKGIERDVFKLLVDKGIKERPIWTSRSNTDGRFVQLCVGTSQSVLFELEEVEFANISAKDIVSCLQNSIGGI